MELHLHLKSARQAAGKTPEQAASYLGVQTDMVYRFERGASQPNLRQLGLLAECYGMQVGDMFPSTRPRMRDLAPLLAALDAFSEDERPDAIAHATRQLQFAAALASSRAARGNGISAARTGADLAAEQRRAVEEWSDLDTRKPNDGAVTPHTDHVTESER